KSQDCLLAPIHAPLSPECILSAMLIHADENTGRIV
ncbi:unnamed protein product, partial [Allacma fusca]